MSSDQTIPFIDMEATAVFFGEKYYSGGELSWSLSNDHQVL